MIVQSAVRWGLAVFLLIVLFACSESTTSGPGVINPPGMGVCRDIGARCVKASDCCTLVCDDGICAPKHP